jgi:hypothetical protein
MKLIKEIKSKEGELHFRRYSIFSLPFFSIYIHKIYKADEDKHHHNHPWDIFTIVLKGSYEEKLLGEPHKIVHKLTTRTPGHFAWRPRNRYHKINQIFSTVTTLAFVFGNKTPWGYWVGEKNLHIDQVEYRKLKNSEK